MLGLCLNGVQNGCSLECMGFGLHRARPLVSEQFRLCLPDSSAVVASVRIHLYRSLDLIRLSTRHSPLLVVLRPKLHNLAVARFSLFENREILLPEVESIRSAFRRPLAASPRVGVVLTAEGARIRARSPRRR